MWQHPAATAAPTAAGRSQGHKDVCSASTTTLQHPQPAAAAAVAECHTPTHLAAVLWGPLLACLFASLLLAPAGAHQPLSACSDSTQQLPRAVLSSCSGSTQRLLQQYSAPAQRALPTLLLGYPTQLGHSAAQAAAAAIVLCHRWYMSWEAGPRAQEPRPLVPRVSPATAPGVPPHTYSHHHHSEGPPPAVAVPAALAFDLGCSPQGLPP